MKLSFIKKIIFLFVLVGISSFAFAQSLPNTNPFQDVSINLSSGVITANIVGSLVGTEIEISLKNTSDNSKVFLSSVPWEDHGFDLTLPASYILTQGSISLNGNQYNAIDISVMQDGTTQNLQTVMISNVTVSGLQTEVTVNWKPIVLKNTNSDNSGFWYYEIQSEGDVIRTTTDQVFLTIEKQPISGGAPTYFNLYTVPPGWITFSICLPNSVCNSSVDSPITESQIIPGYTYKLFFSDQPNSSTVINAADGDGKISLTAPQSPIEETEEEPEETEENNTGSGTTTSNNGSTGSTTTYFNDAQTDVIQNGIVNTDCGYGLSDGGRMCGYSDAIRLIKRIIEYIFVLVLPISAIVFAYAGYLLLTSGGNTEKLKSAKRAMTNVIIGIVVIMAAWLVVKTIATSLGVDDGIANILGN